MANEGMITVGVLFIVGAAVRDTGGVEWIANRLFGRPKTPTTAVARMMIPTMGLSAFMNNTPLVAMLIPAVTDWARMLRMPVSKFMIPLSYAAILGGTCTLIGTSTNLVVQGLVIKEHIPRPGKWAGNVRHHLGRIARRPARRVPTSCLSSRWLLPDRKPALSTQTDPREYTVEMQVAADSPLVGQTIEAGRLAASCPASIWPRSIARESPWRPSRRKRRCVPTTACCSSAWSNRWSICSGFAACCRRPTKSSSSRSRVRSAA